MRVLTLYTTSACHLCEQAQALIQPILIQHELRLRLIDVADSEALMQQYGTRIPVVVLEGEKLDLGWPFDLQTFLDYIQANH